ncbi:MAG TPA: DUF6294 family protein [Candidatus Aquilonibacter sp.]|nr:DUF6294 family protein [Candidatus Aquilonibacter sp.]
MLKRSFTLVMMLAAATALSAHAPQDEHNREAPKTFQWVNQRSGDCHLSGVLTLYPDGRAHWDATTWTDSTHNRDIWHETLQVVNASNQELFGFGVWDSPGMNSPPYGGQYNWSKDGTFPSEFFDQISAANSLGDC